MIDKHAHTQLLCDSIEAARPHIPFKIETNMAEVYPNIPVLVVHRIDRFKPASNLAYVESPALLATISVSDNNKLHIWNHCNDPDGKNFDALVQPLIHPENYTASAQ